ncbi:MAG TPA: hypothetical protein VN633_20205 [Bryobacteraceae bacterium]|nr:hypothetical protein [Bryobacteraceae bacterium]
MTDHRTAVSGPVFRRRVASKLALALLFILFAASSSLFQNLTNTARWTVARQTN